MCLLSEFYCFFFVKRLRHHSPRIQDWNWRRNRIRIWIRSRDETHAASAPQSPYAVEPQSRAMAAAPPPPSPLFVRQSRSSFKCAGSERFPDCWLLNTAMWSLATRNRHHVRSSHWLSACLRARLWGKFHFYLASDVSFRHNKFELDGVRASSRSRVANACSPNVTVGAALRRNAFTNWRLLQFQLYNSNPIQRSFEAVVQALSRTYSRVSRDI